MLVQLYADELFLPGAAECGMKQKRTVCNLLASAEGTNRGT